MDLLISQVDTLGCGDIKYGPLVEQMTAIYMVEAEDKVKNAFNRYDPEHEKSIHYREMKDMVRQFEGVDAEKSQRVIKEIERTSKGLIKFYDFYQVLRTALQI